ncbi:hypothetical protein KIPB_003697, partial [Kipferlia bialata]
AEVSTLLSTLDQTKAEAEAELAKKDREILSLHHLDDQNTALLKLLEARSSDLSSEKSQTQRLSHAIEELEEKVSALDTELSKERSIVARFTGTSSHTPTTGYEFPGQNHADTDSESETEAELSPVYDWPSLLSLLPPPLGACLYTAGREERLCSLFEVQLSNLLQTQGDTDAEAQALLSKYTRVCSSHARVVQMLFSVFDLYREASTAAETADKQVAASQIAIGHVTEQMQRLRVESEGERDKWTKRERESQAELKALRTEKDSLLTNLTNLEAETEQNQHRSDVLLNTKREDIRRLESRLTLLSTRLAEADSREEGHLAKQREMLELVAAKVQQFEGVATKYIAVVKLTETLLGSVLQEYSYPLTRMQRQLDKKRRESPPTAIEHILVDYSS